MLKWAVIAGALVLGYFIMPRKLNAAGLQMIRDFEGLSLTLYDDQGKPAIGYGHNLLPGEEYTRITIEQAEALLRQDVEKYERAVNRAINVPLTQNQFNALVSFTYNVGIGAFERSTLRQKLNRGDYIGASQELQRWTKAGGAHNAGLAKRRAEEIEVFWT